MITVRDLLDLIDRLTDGDPVTWSREGLDDGCFFCGHDKAHYDEPQTHEPDCDWVTARKVIENSRGQMKPQATLRIPHPPG